MRELRRDIDAALAKGWHWPLSLQRMRTLSQDERHEQAAHQALETPDVGISDCDEATRAVLHKLRHPHHHIVEAQQRGRAGV